MGAMKNLAIDQMNETPLVLGPDGRPAPKTVPGACPSCGAGKDQRVASGGFGRPHPVCRRCGFEWHGEEWHG